MTDEKLLKRVEEAVVACNRCGFCTSYCPTYLATGSESHSPRGRNIMFRAMLEGKTQDLTEATQAVDTCLLCGECTHVCFSQVPTAELMVQARAMIMKRKALPWAIKIFFRHILPFPHRLSRLLKAAFLGKRLGIAWMLQKTGLLQRLSPPLAAAEQLALQVPLRFLLDYREAREKQTPSFFETEMALLKAEMNKEKPVRKKEVATVAYFPVCGSQYIRPSIGLSTLFLFDHLKLKHVIPDVLCCGLPAGTSGALDSARAIAEENIRRLERDNYAHIVVDDSSCAAHLKELPKYFQNDPLWLPRAQALAAKVRECSSFLLSQGLADQLRNRTWQGGPVAYHDPCKAQYGQKVIDPPRELLSSMRGLTLMPIPEADQCCGGGGSYSFLQPEISRAVLAAKIKNIISTQASIVVTSSASCLTQLIYGLKQQSSSIKAMHLCEVLHTALK
jgi:glycolate oxidase iron-sulfur subunit